MMLHAAVILALSIFSINIEAKHKKWPHHHHNHQKQHHNYHQHHYPQHYSHDYHLHRNHINNDSQWDPLYRKRKVVQDTVMVEVKNGKPPIILNPSNFDDNGTGTPISIHHHGVRYGHDEYLPSPVPMHKTFMHGSPLQYHRSKHFAKGKRLNKHLKRSFKKRSSPMILHHPRSFKLHHHQPMHRPMWHHPVVSAGLGSKPSCPCMMHHSNRHQKVKMARDLYIEEKVLKKDLQQGLMREYQRKKYNWRLHEIKQNRHLKGLISHRLILTAYERKLIEYRRQERELHRMMTSSAATSDMKSLIASYLTRLKLKIKFAQKRATYERQQLELRQALINPDLSPTMRLALQSQLLSIKKQMHKFANRGMMLSGVARRRYVLKAQIKEIKAMLQSRAISEKVRKLLQKHLNHLNRKLQLINQQHALEKQIMDANAALQGHISPIMKQALKFQLQQLNARKRRLLLQAHPIDPHDQRYYILKRQLKELHKMYRSPIMSKSMKRIIHKQIQKVRREMRQLLRMKALRRQIKDLRRLLSSEDLNSSMRRELKRQLHTLDDEYACLRSGNKSSRCHRRGIRSKRMKHRVKPTVRGKVSKAKHVVHRAERAVGRAAGQVVHKAAQVAHKIGTAARKVVGRLLHRSTPTRPPTMSHIAPPPPPPPPHLHPSPLPPHTYGGHPTPIQPPHQPSPASLPQKIMGAVSNLIHRRNQPHSSPTPAANLFSPPQNHSSPPPHRPPAARATLFGLSRRLRR